MTRTAKLLVACFFVFLASQLWFKVYDSDTWFHLNVGRFILQHHSIPDVNTFSFTEPGRSWMPHEWLSQVVFYMVFSLFGATGLGLLRLAVFMTVFIFLFRLVHKPGWEAVNVVALMATVGVILWRFTDRPEMFSALFFISYFHILEQWRKKETRWIWTIPVLQLLWINMHGYFLLGLLFLFLFWLGEFGIKEGLLARSRQSNQLMKVAGAGLLACFINPHFHNGIFQLLSVARSIGDPHIMEWQPPYGSLADFWRVSWADAEKRLIWVTGLLLVLNLRNRRTTYWLLWLVFLAAFLKSSRNVLFFALAAIPIMLINLRGILEDITAKMKGRGLKPILELSLTGLLLFGARDVASGDYYMRNGVIREWGLGISSIFPPVEACDFVEQTGIKGPFFNNYGIGNYLMWRFPDEKVFIDGRNREAYSREFLSYYHQLMRGDVTISNLAKKYSLQSFILSHTYPDTDTLGMIAALRRDPKWKLVYIDHTSVVFVPSGHAAAKKLVIRTSDDIPRTSRNKWELAWRHYQLSDILDRFDRREAAIEESRKALMAAPNFQQGRLQLQRLLSPKKDGLTKAAPE